MVAAVHAIGQGAAIVELVHGGQALAAVLETCCAEQAVDRGDAETGEIGTYGVGPGVGMARGDEQRTRRAEGDHHLRVDGQGKHPAGKLPARHERAAPAHGRTRESMMQAVPAEAFEVLAVVTAHGRRAGHA